jgi:hypothetical protein
VRFVTVLGFCLVLVLMLCAQAGAASTYFTTPGAKPTAECSEEDGCSLEKAVSKAADGDTVTVGPGEYVASDLPSAPLRIEDEIEIGGEVGSRPVIHTGATRYLNVSRDAGPGTLVHDLSFEGAGPLLVESGTVERVFVSYSSQDAVVAEPPAACIFRLDNVSSEATIRDSVCWSNELFGASTAAALRVSVGTEGPPKVMTVRNLTAIASGRGGDGIEAFAGGSAQVLVDAKNVVARATNGSDVAATAADPKVQPRALVRLTGSNYATVRDSSFEIDVTDPGVEGNQTAAPEFVDAANGDFHQTETSPTLDAGVDDELNGSIDIDGAGRTQPSCLGASAASLPDIGAYESSPAGQCTVAPPPPPPPLDPRKAQFRILKLRLNRHTGTGKVRIEVPGAGTAAVTGSGIKFVTRQTTEAGVLTLPLQPWAITLVRLNKFGKTRIQVKVKFEPSGGGTLGQRATSILLKRKRKPA